MGRRGFGISATSVNRLISSYSAREKQRERERLIHENYDLEKEKPPVYEISDINFNSQTRNTKIIFTRIQQYRTVERYVTQNYQRFPVYSYWKTREKTISKSIKLTNFTLENLYNHDDDLIQDFAEEIILSLNCNELIPSWLQKNIFHEDFKTQTHEQNEKIKNAQNSFKTLRSNKNETIDKINNELVYFEKAKNKYNNKIAKKERQISKIENYKSSLLLNFITLFLYAAFHSTKRKIRLEKKKQNIILLLENNQLEIDNRNNLIAKIRNDINIAQEVAASEIQSIKTKIDDIKREYETHISQIQVLDSTYQDDNTFVSLKKFIGFDYEKIIGCYVIHNTENHKYYVGQSKDVMRRIKQHFKGTVPNNIIFAEDHYASQLNDRDNLFEIKIITCETKDELDRTERQLIEDYNSREYGYNGTSGNT